MSRKQRDSTGASQDEHDRLERFLSAFNSIDQSLKKQTGTDPKKSFTAGLVAFEATHRLGESGDFLRTVNDLRNVIVHGKLKPYLQLAIPTEPIVSRLESIAEEFVNPACVLPAFQGKVELVQMNDSLKDVLVLIDQRDYSQFPVFNEDRFQGLLTENGITRWLAGQVSNALSLVDFEDAKIRQVLKQEGNRRNYHFVDRKCTIRRAEQTFREQDLLEAIFITHTGKKTESILGIMTRWDILDGEI